jgi:hypothetical protein
MISFLPAQKPAKFTAYFFLPLLVFQQKSLPRFGIPTSHLKIKTALHVKKQKP